MSVFFYHALGSSFGFDKLPWSGNIRNLYYSSDFLFLYPFSFGEFGVSIFFVISGYCIHLSYQRSVNKDWFLYFTRRFFRIYPAYLIFMLIFISISYIPSDLFFQTPFESVLIHSILLHNFSKEFIFGINPSFWTIAVEIQLYLLYPLLLLISKKIGWNRSLVFCFMIEIFFRYKNYILVDPEYNREFIWLNNTPFHYWGSWSIGAFLCDSHLRQKATIFSKLNIYALCIIFLFSSFYKPLSMLSFPLIALITTAIMERFHQGKWTLKQSNKLSIIWNHISDLGIISYSFYLLHQPFLLWGGRLIRDKIPPIHSFLILICLYPFVYMICKISYKHIELKSIYFGKIIQNKLYPNTQDSVQLP
jgi:peptidoglycan/LPS O-acetylase OafA/YrhL